LDIDNHSGGGAARDRAADRPPGEISMNNAITTEDADELMVLNLRQLSPKQFSNLGVSQLAYVKPVLLNGAKAFAIHGADGTPMAVAGDEAVALAAIEQHEMVATRVH
jgi:hypothetical protein